MVTEHPWLSFHQEIQKLSKAAHRSVRVIPVSKGQSPEKILFGLSQEDFPRDLAESYLDEALEKIQDPSLKGQKLHWHFLGRLQSRKIPDLLRIFEYLHSVSRLKELDVIAKHGLGTKIFLQVNTSGEIQKNGFDPAEVPDALQHAANLGIHKNILGFMTLPAPLEDVGEAEIRREFKVLRQLRDKHFPNGLLNMGTSSDYHVAIEEGADWVRIGTRLFGEREV